MRCKKLAAVAGVCTTLALAGEIDAGDKGAGAGGACLWDCGEYNGVVDTVDFLVLLFQWGETGVTCDFDNNGVDVLDFLELLNNWGPCP